MDMRTISVNIDSVNFEGLEGVSDFYPIPMPVLSRPDGEGNVLIYSLMSKQEWSQKASLSVELDTSRMVSVPIKLPKSLFDRQFIPLGKVTDSGGIYGKIPTPVSALKTDVTCSYRVGLTKYVAEPNSVLVKSRFGSFRHYEQVDFDTKFVKDLEDLLGMEIKYTQAENRLDDDLEL